MNRLVRFNTFWKQLPKACKFVFEIPSLVLYVHALYLICYYSVYKSRFKVSSVVSRVFLGRPVHTLNPQRHDQGWRWGEKFSKFLPPNTQKIQSVALSVLRFLCNTFSKLFKLTLWKTLFCGYLKNSYIQISVRAAKQSELEKWSK